MKMSFTAIPACQNLFAIIQEESCLKPDFECVVEGALINHSQNSLWISLADCPRICGWTYLDTFLNVILLSQLAWYYSMKINERVYLILETSEYSHMHCIVQQFSRLSAKKIVNSLGLRSFLTCCWRPFTVFCIIVLAQNQK